MMLCHIQVCFICMQVDNHINQSAFDSDMMRRCGDALESAVPCYYDSTVARLGVLNLKCCPDPSQKFGRTLAKFTLGKKYVPLLALYSPHGTLESAWTSTYTTNPCQMQT